MKKTLFTLILSGSIFFSLHAQTFKPTVGFNFTDVTVNNEIGQGKNGWQTGVSIAFGEKMYVEPGIFIFQKVLNSRILPWQIRLILKQT